MFVTTDQPRRPPDHVVPGQRHRRKHALEYAALMWLAYAVPLLLVVLEWASVSVALPLISAPIALNLYRQLRTREGAPLNETLAGTAKLLLVYGILFTIGLALAAV